MPITNLIRDNWCRFQGELFPEIQDAVGPLLKNHQRLVMALGIICPEDFTLRTSQRNGRPLCDRINLVRAFIAKAICDIPTTRDLGGVLIILLTLPLFLIHFKKIAGRRTAWHVQT